MIDPNQMITDMINNWEGGYVNIPEDSGGPTNMGITEGILSVWYGRPAKAQDILDLTLEEAIKIYKKLFYYFYHIDTMPEILQPMLFDMFVNHSPKSAGIMVQRALNGLIHTAPLIIDGILGDQSILRMQSLLQTYTAQIVIRAIVRERELYYKNLVAKDPSQSKFLNGWLRRADSYLIG